MKAPSLATAFLQSNLVPGSRGWLRPAPYPSPCSPHSASSTLYPSSCILQLSISHPPPFIPHPSPFIPPPSPASSPPCPSPLISCPSPRSPHPPPFISCPSPFVPHPSPFPPPSFPCLQWDQRGWGCAKGSKAPGKRGPGGQRSRAGPGAGPNEAVLTKRRPPPAMGLCPVGIPGQGQHQSLLNPPWGLALGLPPCLGAWGCFGCWVPSFRVSTGQFLGLGGGRAALGCPPLSEFVGAAAPSSWG